MWWVGINISKDEVKGFYFTDNFQLARQMFLMLNGMGYKRVITNAHWYEDLD